MSARIKIISFLLLSSISLSAAEIVLKNGDAFIADILENDANKVRIRWKEKTFDIPKSEIQNIDTEKKGEHISYHYDTIILKDGTQIKGVIVRQNTNDLIVKTELGLLTIEKSKLENAKSLIPDKYNVDLPPEKNSNIGLTGSYSAFAQSSNNVNQASGGGLFIEPSFVHFNSRWRLGYKLEYLESINSRFRFYNNFLYLQYNWKKSNWIDFYANLGIGGSIVNYKYTDKTVTGSDPAGYLEVGWGGLSFGKVIIRLGIIGIYLYENGGGPGFGGGTISIGAQL
ncbi:MAG TPA: hypothetical protein PK079_03125 [Leptospiraceae bacterium]|nr:hypothetical protein [Leptospiraceae bacterium]HNE52137.1 hypothetical protein [Leptospiraceae bacterium]